MAKGTKSDFLDAEPFYPDVYKYGNFMLKHVTWEGDPWQEVGESYFKSAYIHAGLSGIEETFQGPNTLFKFLVKLLYKF